MSIASASPDAIEMDPPLASGGRSASAPPAPSSSFQDPNRRAREKHRNREGHNKEGWGRAETIQEAAGNENMCAVMTFLQRKTAPTFMEASLLAIRVESFLQIRLRLRNDKKKFNRTQIRVSFIRVHGEKKRLLLNPPTRSYMSMLRHDSMFMACRDFMLMTRHDFMSMIHDVLSFIMVTINHHVLFMISS